MTVSVVIGVLLAIAAFVYVSMPFFRPDANAAAAEGPGDSGDERTKWERQKIEAYSAIKDAEFDYRMNKLSDADFAAQKERYAGQALAAIAALESDTGRKGGATRRPIRIAFCPSCGGTVPPRANFCAACGRGLRDAVA